MEQRTAEKQEKAAGRLPLQAARLPKTAESGQTLLEFALMLPFMMLLLLGIAEIGRAAFMTITVNNGATAGVEWGSQNSTGASPGGIIAMQNAATADAIVTGMTATATYGCICDYGSGISCNQPLDPAQCTISCPGGQVVDCVQVTTHLDFDSLFHYPGLPQTFQANGKAVERVRQ